MLKVIKYILFLILFIICIATGITAFVLSDKEQSIETINKFSLNTMTNSPENESDVVKEEKAKGLSTVLTYGGAFVLLLIISGVFYRFVFNTYSKKEGNPS